jgi:hypothetical protein
MAHEFDVAQAASLGGFFRRRAEHAAPPGTPCANCGTILEGPWCHACGQLGEDFHRSWLRLVGESVEGILHLDGRVWLTMAGLVTRPGRLTRSYLEGHRVPQIPPLRLFLVILLLVFAVGSLTAGKVRLVSVDSTNNLTVGQKAQIKSNIQRMQFRFDHDKHDSSNQVRSWMSERAQKVVDNPEFFSLVLETWAERFAFMMLPISALLLSILFVFQRRFFLFDHMVFSLHSLSFLGLFIAAYMLASSAAAVLLPRVHDAVGWLLLAPAIHLFAHMRGVYATSILGTLLRMALLFIGSVIGFLVLMAGLLFVGLANV